jgi:hypothetical protein
LYGLEQFVDHKKVQLNAFLEKIYNRLYQQGEFYVHDWTKRPSWRFRYGQFTFGVAMRYAKGVPVIFELDKGFAIKGFWRGNEGTLNGIKLVLAG